MTDHELQEPAPQRRRWVLIGASGAAVAMVGGALLIAQNRDAQQESLTEPPTVVVAPATSASPAQSPVTDPADSPEPSRTTASPRKTEATGEPEVRTAKEIREEITKAREDAEKDGIALQRPVQAAGDVAAQSEVTEKTEQIENGTVRVTTAHHDLTGQSTLLLAGDRGKAVGEGVSCTNKVRFSRDVPASVRPTLLLCWRTSKARSVVTMMATPQGEPSADTSVDIINREWAKL